ncbi:MAG: hypothetical protein ACKOW9_01370 [Candidatus Paceibacterota bacterium]
MKKKVAVLLIASLILPATYSHASVKPKRISSSKAAAFIKDGYDNSLQVLKTKPFLLTIWESDAEGDVYKETLEIDSKNTVLLSQLNNSNAPLQTYIKGDKLYRTVSTDKVSWGDNALTPGIISYANSINLAGSAKFSVSDKSLDDELLELEGYEYYREYALEQIKALNYFESYKRDYKKASLTTTIKGSLKTLNIKLANPVDQDESEYKEVTYYINSEVLTTIEIKTVSNRKITLTLSEKSLKETIKIPSSPYLDISSLIESDGYKEVIDYEEALFAFSSLKLAAEKYAENEGRAIASIEDYLAAATDLGQFEVELEQSCVNFEASSDYDDESFYFHIDLEDKSLSLNEGSCSGESNDDEGEENEDDSEDDSEDDPAEEDEKD